MSTETRAERLRSMQLRMDDYGGVAGIAIRDLAEIVATLLPSQPAPVDLPAVFHDRDGDMVRVAGSPDVPTAVRLYTRTEAGAVDILPHDVDRFVAAVLKAAGR